MNSEILFNKEFYELEAIKRACIDYKHIAGIQVEIEDSYYLCRIHECNIDANIVKNELSNYVLAMSIKLMRYMEE